MGCHALIQGIFPTQGSNPSLPHCKQLLYHLSHWGSPRILEWVAYPFSRGFSQPRNTTGISCISGGFFTSWATRGDQGSVSGLGRSPGEGNGYPLQYSSLKNSMDRRICWLQATGSKKVRHNWVTNVLRIPGLIEAFLFFFFFSFSMDFIVWILATIILYSHFNLLQNSTFHIARSLHSPFYATFSWKGISLNHNVPDCVFVVMVVVV